jgi:hypothetical protein
MKLFAITLAVFLLLLSQLSRAQNVSKVPKGTTLTTTEDVWIVKDSQMQEFAKTHDKLELTEKLVKTNEQLLKLSDTEMEFYKRRSQSQAKELDKAESRRFWATAGAFALGVVLTGVAAKAAIEASK